MSIAGVELAFAFAEPEIITNLSGEADVYITKVTNKVATARVLRQRTNITLSDLRWAFSLETPWAVNHDHELANTDAEMLAAALLTAGCTVYIRYGVLEDYL